jgi:HEPN domain-containing protein
MTRYDLQQLVKVRLHEAHLLLNGRSYSGAYYLAGYAIECALKACIARQTREFDFPDKDRAVKSYTHRPKDLIAVAGLSQRLQADLRSHPELQTNWEIVQNWTEHSRYELRTEADARLLLEAIERPQEGVLAWVTRHW